MTKKDELANVDNLEIEPLSDADLSSVAGGAEATSTGYGCSCTCCFAVSKPSITEEGDGTID
jgi:hypothetical protein